MHGAVRWLTPEQPTDALLSLCCLYANRYHGQEAWHRLCERFASPLAHQVQVFGSHEDTGLPSASGLRMVTFVFGAQQSDACAAGRAVAVFAFRGTLLSRFGNLTANYQIMTGSPGHLPIVRKALAAMAEAQQALKDAYPGVAFEYVSTGHSLGGFVAKAVAVVLHSKVKRCVAFEAPGLTAYYHTMAAGQPKKSRPSLASTGGAAAAAAAAIVASAAGQVAKQVSLHPAAAAAAGAVLLSAAGQHHLEPATPAPGTGLAAVAAPAGAVACAVTQLVFPALAPAPGWTAAKQAAPVVAHCTAQLPTASQGNAGDLQAAAAAGPPTLSQMTPGLPAAPPAAILRADGPRGTLSPALPSASTRSMWPTSPAPNTRHDASSGTAPLKPGPWQQRITSYVAAPNAINTCQRHLGRMVRVYTREGTDLLHASRCLLGTTVRLANWVTLLMSLLAVLAGGLAGYSWEVAAAATPAEALTASMRWVLFASSVFLCGSLALGLVELLEDHLMFSIVRAFDHATGQPVRSVPIAKWPRSMRTRQAMTRHVRRLLTESIMPTRLADGIRVIGSRHFTAEVRIQSLPGYKELQTQEESQALQQQLQPQPPYLTATCTAPAFATYRRQLQQQQLQDLCPPPSPSLPEAAPAPGRRRRRQQQWQQQTMQQQDSAAAGPSWRSSQAWPRQGVPETGGRQVSSRPVAQGGGRGRGREVRMPGPHSSKRPAGGSPTRGAHRVASYF